MFLKEKTPDLNMVSVPKLLNLSHYGGKIMDYKFYLPDKDNNPIENVTQNNSVIIIGANGSGKSKLGEWMEKKNEKEIHRIGAQRSLTFDKYIQQRSYEQAYISGTMHSGSRR